jgi:hypothetical protein
MMRMLIRLGLLALAAFGAKTIYEKLAPRKDSLRATGTEFVDRTGSAAREMASMVSIATQRMVANTPAAASDVAATAKARVAEVKLAADEAGSQAVAELKDASTPERPLGEREVAFGSRSRPVTSWRRNKDA